MNQKNLIARPSKKTLSLAEKAEKWGNENGIIVPPRNTESWWIFFGAWVDKVYGFEKFEKK